jgi:hypothetical protein
MCLSPRRITDEMREKQRGALCRSHVSAMLPAAPQRGTPLLEQS